MTYMSYMSYVFERTRLCVTEQKHSISAVLHFHFPCCTRVCFVWPLSRAVLHSFWLDVTWQVRCSHFTTYRATMFCATSSNLLLLLNHLYRYRCVCTLCRDETTRGGWMHTDRSPILLLIVLQRISRTNNRHTETIDDVRFRHRQPDIMKSKMGTRTVRVTENSRWTCNPLSVNVSTLTRHTLLASTNTLWSMRLSHSLKRDMLQVHTHHTHTHIIPSRPE